MANQYTITIRAVDKASEVGRKIGQAFNRLASPVRGLNSAYKAFGKEAGLDKANKAIAGFGRSISKVSNIASKLVPEAAGLGEIGDAAVGIGAAASGLGALAAGVVAVAGVTAALTAKWASFGFGLKQSSLFIGDSVQDLQKWRGAAALMGIDAKTVDASLTSLGDTLEDATYGRNQTALAFMSQLGIRLRRAKDGSIDLNDELLQISDVLQRFKNNPEAQRMIARQFGVDALLPILRQGRAATQKYLAEGQKNAIPDADVEDAAHFQERLNKWNVQLQAMLFRLPGQLKRGNPTAWMGMTDFLLGPPGWMKAGIQTLTGLALSGAKAQWRRFWTDLGSEARPGVNGVKPYFERLWADIIATFKDGADRVLAIWNPIANLGKKLSPGGAVGAGLGGFVSHLPAIAGAGLNKAIAVRDDLAKDLGLNPFQAAGIVSNLYAESGLRGINERHPLIPGSRGGFGWAQWTGPRRRQFEAYAAAHHLDPSSDAANYGFLVEDMKSRHGGILGAVRAARTAHDAAIAAFQYESGGARSLAHHAADHAALADKIAGGQVHVDVTVHHDGHRAHARTRTRGAVSAHARIARSLQHVPA